MPTTRAATGNSKPRVIQQIEAVVAPKKRTTANTSKPRAKTVASGRVEKKSTTTTKPKKTVAVKKSPVKKVTDKVVGKAKKAEGTVEGNPAKKAAGTKKEKSTAVKKVSAAPRTKATVKA
ncbi:hypothetical protein B0J11DRAFT_584488 [Dendryphion nanum]|uniref:Uncharacterized protein n=1 Tax=Dendryphion nanum TaxID=256645 RepID=A0A9P9DA25_9PLEO|nr:hypothetical protein B0J11DRAFT_584488 [Dendryphion nanum]